jgi:hypothetical protein
MMTDLEEAYDAARVFLENTAMEPASIVMSRSTYLNVAERLSGDDPKIVTHLGDGGPAFVVLPDFAWQRGPIAIGTVAQEVLLGITRSGGR